jgi:mannose-6-phosphate isomerase class I
MLAQPPSRYEPEPTYSPVDGVLVSGWTAIAATVPRHCRVLAIDGPAALDWQRTVASLSTAFAAQGLAATWQDMRDYGAPWDQIVKRTGAGALAEDPDFAPLATGNLAEMFDALPATDAPAEGILIRYGPGAALVEHDVLWYVDQPKRYAEAAVRAGDALNLGQPRGSQPGTLRRLFYVDWPLSDRHRDSIATRIDRWIDLQDPGRPTSLDGGCLLRTLAGLAQRPFRTRPTFNTTSWGGHWAQRTLGANPQAPNTALGYELIAPESGVLIGNQADAIVEIPFQLLVSRHPAELLGRAVHATFGSSFPIRFDYLDTVDGGNLSVHCHPQDDYMREVFGWPYTQHETYYIMVGGQDRQVFLGLREGADVDRFREQAHAADHAGRAFDIEQFIQTFPATPHQLFLVPAGTPHGSGEGNVVLEVSATPYLYSLRFYDWLRQDGEGQQRPIHVDHAFRNLDAQRSGDSVRRDLIQTPRTLSRGAGWREEVVGRLPEMFFEVRRLVVDAHRTTAADTAGRFHVLNVVDGEGVLLETADGHLHPLYYAETIVIPGAVGRYTVTALGSRALVVKALVR